MTLFVGTLLTIALLLTPGRQGDVSQAIDPPPAEEQAPELQTPEPQADVAPIEVPVSLEEALAVEPAKLKRQVADQSSEVLEGLLQAWMGFLEQQQAALEQALAADEGTELRRTSERLGLERDSLVAAVEVLVAGTADAGGSAETARSRLAEIRQTEIQGLDRVSTVPRDQSAAQDLSLEVLRAQLRPLTKAQVSDQLEQWLALLQRKCLEVRKVEVAAL